MGRLLLTHIPAWVDEIGQLFAASAVFSETELVPPARSTRSEGRRWRTTKRDGVRLTSLDQPLGDGLDVTKGDLVDYLDAVADRMVPLLAGRPLSVKRVRPGQAPFMQRNVSKGAPDWVRTVADVVGGLAPRDRTRCSATTGARCCGWPTSAPSSSTCRSSGSGRPSPPAWCSTSTRPRAPTSRSSSAPPGSSGRRWTDAGLAGAVKTSGSKGLHVVVPVRGSPFEDVAAATRALAARTERLDPELATTAYIKEDRRRPGLRRLHPVGPGHDRGRLQPADPARACRCPRRWAGTPWTTCGPATSP